MKTLLALLLLIPNLSLGNDKIYLNIKDFITSTISMNKILSLCKENHDEEMGRFMMLETLNAAVNEKLINEFQKNEIEISIGKSEEKAEIVVRDEGCDYATSLLYSSYIPKYLELKKFFVEQGILD